ncbi:MAG: GntR family transcriptional regulator [Bacteroidales bacterium]|nr:GntR family transcriptional regulator [Bacteroidales bacterium]
MTGKIYVVPSGRKPIYKQLTEHFQKDIHMGILSPGDMLPSMNDLSRATGISKETVKKAYAILVDRGLVVPKQGKGFFVAEIGSSAKPSVLLLFDRLSIYKQLLFNSFAQEMSDRAEITILTHNQSLDLFEYYLDDHLDDYDYYVITPHFPLDAESQARALRLLSRVPNRKLIMLDRWMKELPGNYGAVYQDFENDACDGLLAGREKLSKCKRLVTVTLPASLYGSMVCKGVEKAVAQLGIDAEYVTSVPDDIRRGDTFLLLNSQLDWGVADLARKIKASGLEIGKDVGIISYNEIALNEVVLGGLTTISADFSEMGRLAARMILDRSLSKIHCPFGMTRRSTF